MPDADTDPNDIYWNPPDPWALAIAKRDGTAEAKAPETVDIYPHASAGADAGRGGALEPARSRVRLVRGVGGCEESVGDAGGGVGENSELRKLTLGTLGYPRLEQAAERWTP